MKRMITLVIASFISATPLFAAKMTFIEKMTNPVTEGIARTVAKADSLHDDDSRIKVVKVSYTLTNQREDPVNTIKQLIYRLAGSDVFWIPESVDVDALPKNISGVSAAVELMLTPATMSDASITASLNQSLNEVMTTDNDTMIYRIKDQNGFGGCTGAVVLDARDMEILMVRSCWSE
jgi:hypothetical protein